MKITDLNEIKNILSEFPKFELYYEKIVHNKVHETDINLAIPEGKNIFAWFRTYNNDNVCFIMEISNNEQINSIEMVLLSFSDYLCIEYGTILYGKLFKLNSQNIKIANTKCVSIEDIYYYKGEKMNNKTYYNRLKTLKNILNNEIIQTVLTKNTVLFGLPYMNTNYNNLYKEINLLPYKVDKIKLRNSNNNLEFSLKYTNNINKYNKQTLEKAIFKVVPDIQNDIYNLYVYNNGKEELFDIALIPDYKTSVMMNKLFRNIKENKNLDFLEESDDEEEFENEGLDKYVYLDRWFKMNCMYNNKFKKWYPISLANKEDKIVSLNYL